MLDILAQEGISMLKAIVTQVRIVPLDPLPPEWKEGMALDVTPAGSNTIDIDRWLRDFNDLSADSSLENELAMFGAIAEQHRQAKEHTRPCHH